MATKPLQATLWIPFNGAKVWTDFMQGRRDVPDDFNVGSPIVMSSTTFSDGVQVMAGVYKSEEPKVYNIVFFWVFAEDGSQVPGWPIDPSDWEDFDAPRSIGFSLEDSDQDESDEDDSDEEERPEFDYLLQIKEKSSS
ncbi:expressed unknown protein [Seminavis robusta]|uniref:Uncharacterized protein n=1 Tax=Seminavis robusta TaxID=568900 RepID=A0A9N8EB89_9STRA|nr:expressed unknown protein [Seminavis robusta]|eukprot:Sro839_g209280.1 n/a (138) ;mRNA; r:25415-25828